MNRDTPYAMLRLATDEIWERNRGKWSFCEQCAMFAFAQTTSNCAAPAYADCPLIATASRALAKEFK